MKNPAQTLLPLGLLPLTLALTACGPAQEKSAASSAAPTATAAPAEVAATTPGDATAGKRVYERVCAVCHLVNGVGVPGAFPPLVGSDVATGDPARLIRIVLHGLQGPIEVKGKTYNNVMPPQGPLLKDFEIANVLTYVRSAWGHTAPPVTVEAVSQIRATEKRSTMWTWAELTAATK